MSYIFIGLKLFGKSYSGLEYDYRGLLHLYNKLDEYEKILEYTDTLTNWKELRDKHAQTEDSPIDLQKRPQPIEVILTRFFSMWYTNKCFTQILRHDLSSSKFTDFRLRL